MLPLLLLSLLTQAPAGGAAPPHHHHASAPDSGSCGTWQAGYTRLHREILQGERPPRYAVSVAIESGLADRLRGTVAAFYYALLTGRAFQVATYRGVPSFADALAAPHIDWGRKPVPEEVAYEVKASYQGVGGAGEPALPATLAELDALQGAEEEGGPGGHGRLYLVNNWGLAEAVFKGSDLARVPRGQSELETVYVATNLGATLHLFANPHHGPELRKLGLAPETAFACAAHYLFRPQAAVLAAAREEAEALQLPTGAPYLGIQVRVGDAALHAGGSEALDWGRHEGHFLCAAELEGALRAGGLQGPLPWYLISDSLALRRRAKALFGARVLTDTARAPAHTDCTTHPLPGAPTPMAGCSGAPEAHAAAWHRALAEMLLFSRAAHQVVSLQSGFGVVAAWLEGHRHNVSTFSVPRQPSWAKCVPEKADSLELRATAHAGL